MLQSCHSCFVQTALGATRIDGCRIKESNEHELPPGGLRWCGSAMRGLVPCVDKSHSSDRHSQYQFFTDSRQSAQLVWPQSRGFVLQEECDASSFGLAGYPFGSRCQGVEDAGLTWRQAQDRFGDLAHCSTSTAWARAGRAASGNRAVLMRAYASTSSTVPAAACAASSWPTARTAMLWCWVWARCPASMPAVRFNRRLTLTCRCR